VTLRRLYSTNTISEVGDMLWRVTVHFIGTDVGTPNINNNFTSFTNK
jgi:hypothetical protein